MQKKKILIIILLYFTAFAVTLAFIVPPFESPDENLHLDYINYLSKYGKLPDQYEDYNNPEKFVGQGHQPPLYYILLSSLNYAINNGAEIKLNVIHNKKHELFGGTEGKVPNYNYYTGNAFNDFRTKKMFYVLRLISVLLGLITLVFVYKIASLVFSDSRSVLLSVFLAASLPQFAFINAVINNDSLAILLMTISIYYLYKIIINPSGIRNYIVAGVFIGLSVLTKKTLLFSVPGVAVLALYFIFRSKSQTCVLIRNISVLLLIAAIISGVYFIRNQVIYGDLLGSQMELDTMSQHIANKSLLSSFFIIKFLPAIYHSFIGSFGWMNVKLPLVIYGMVSLVFIASAAGYLLHVKSKRVSCHVVVHADSLITSSKSFSNEFVNYGFVLILLALSVLIYANLSFSQAQGRYLLPLISAISVNVVYGVNLFSEKFKISENIKLIYLFIVLIMVSSAVASVITICSFYFSTDFYL